MPTDATTLLDALVRRLGDDAVIGDADRQAPYLTERRGLFHGRAMAVVRPADTRAVADTVALCAEAGVPVVPQGGNTGLCGGASPDADGGSIVLSLERLTRVRAVDAGNFTLTVDAGCRLADVQRAATAVDRLFPLSYAAEEQCCIGGNLATNAGGMNVLRYGNARDLVLGLEVVLADGRIWDGLTTLRKDNSGYDLKDLFIGAEGTLGIITGAVLKLFPRPRHRVTVLVGLDRAEDAVNLLGRLRADTGDGMSAFEFMSRTAIDFAVRHGEGCREPFRDRTPWLAVCDVTSTRRQDDLPAVVGGSLRRALLEGGVRAFELASDEAGCEALWRIRRSIPGAQRHEGGSIKHDISVPVSRVPEFLARADAAVHERLPDVRPCAFGHVGDGNIHYNLSQPPGMDTAAFLARWDEFNRLVHDIVADMGGSFAAEHGVGRLKPAEVARLKHPVEVDLMRRVKRALDPAGLLNPGKVTPP